MSIFSEFWSKGFSHAALACRRTADMCVTACEDVDATFALQMNTVRLIQRPFSTVSRGLFNLRSVGHAVPQCSVIEIHQGSNSLFHLTFAAPMLPSDHNDAPR